jgi:hypothetical protein
MCGLSSQQLLTEANVSCCPQVAMAAGFIDPEPVEKVRPPRKQVLVVVTASWQVLCFDHNLALMWEVAIEDSMPPNARLAEVSAPHAALCCCLTWSTLCTACGVMSSRVFGAAAVVLGL